MSSDIAVGLRHTGRSSQPGAGQYRSAATGCCGAIRTAKRRRQRRVRCFAETNIRSRLRPGQGGLSAPVFDLQSLPGEDALDDAGLRVDEMQSLSVMPRVVWRPMEMWRARDRQARHHDDVPLAFVVVSGYLFMSEPAWHVALPVLRAKGRAWPWRPRMPSAPDQTEACTWLSAPTSVSLRSLLVTHRNTLAPSYTTR